MQHLESERLRRNAQAAIEGGQHEGRRSAGAVERPFGRGQVHIVEFYQLLGGGLKDAGWMREHMSQNRLAILPDLTHYEIFIAPELARTVLPFLNGESGKKSWAEQVAQ